MLLWSYWEQLQDCCRDVQLRPGHVLGEFSCQLLGSLWACMNFLLNADYQWWEKSGPGSRDAAWRFWNLYLWSSSSQLGAAVSEWDLHPIHGIQDACPISWLSRKKKKNLCLLVSEEHPENNGLDITDFTVYFWLSLILPAGQHFPLPPVSPCVSNLLPSSGWGWCSGTAGEAIGVDRLCTQRNPSGWQRGCNQRKPSSDAWTTPPSCFK